jgi:serine protease Do
MKLFRSGFGVSMLSLAALTAGYFGGRPLLEQVEFARAAADVQSTREQLSTVEDLSTVFRHVGKVVEPSVVQLTVIKTVKGQRGDDIRRYFRQHGFGDMPFNFDDGNGNGNGDSDQGQSEEEKGTGSGVIVDADNGYGYILTNNHVAGDATSIRVLLADGREISGANVKLLGADAKSDLAVVQIKADRLIPAKWGNSDDLEKGDWVMAFGSPFGYVGSMTHGIVSALNRNNVEQGTQDYENFLQVDAPINPGNSGGPLVNIHGEVIGINTAIATVSGGFQGVSFAIPSNQAHTVYDALRAHGKVIRGWLGVGIADVNDDQIRPIVKYWGYTGDTGVFVQETFPNTPAFGKLHEGDVITAINGQPVATRDQLRNMIASMPPNTVVTLRVFHDKKDQDVQVTLGNQPDDLMVFSGQGNDGSANGSGDQAAQTPEAMGMTLQDLDQDTADRLGLNNLHTGAVITDVTPKSAADKAGLQKGDVITKVGLLPVHSAQEAIAALKKVDVSKGVPLYIVTRQGSQFVYVGGDDSQN